MILIDPVSINFTIPATDHLGKNAVVGKVRFLADRVELNSRYKGNVFRGEEEKLVTIELPYSEIENVEVIKGWFGIKRIILSIGDPQKVKELPGILMGKLEMYVEKASKKEAKKLKHLVDFKRSEFILDAHEDRLKAIREES